MVAWGRNSLFRPFYYVEKEKIMRNTIGVLAVLTLFCIFIACSGDKKVAPVVITQPVAHDSDDPAIWFNRANPAQSIVLGTDKDEDGAIYAFDMDGRIIEEKTVRGIARPNNVDVGYGLSLNGQLVDIAVVTERLTSNIRIFRLPDMVAIDNGGIRVFEGEQQAAPMGISMYKRPSDGTLFVIVSRKQGPVDGNYLWQYRLEGNSDGTVQANKVRSFGMWSGKKEIEAVAVDNELGYVYYSDEGVGVRKYHADPDAQDAGKELALFATEGFGKDQEGIAITRKGENGGWIIVSDQENGALRFYSRKGKSSEYPHCHELKKVVKTSALETDGIEVMPNLVLPEFPEGVLVTMSDDKTFHYYSLKDMIDTKE